MAIGLTGRHASQGLRFREDGDCVDTRDRNTTRRPLAIGPVLISVFILLLSCSEEPVAPEAVARPVKMIEFGASGGGARSEYPGEVSPATNAEVAFEVSGKLIDFPVTESQQVKRGDLLAKLDPRDYQSNLDAARASANASRADYSRMKALFDQDVASQQELERALRNYEVTAAQIDKAQKAVDDTMLRAPFDGVVARKIANDFDNVQAKQPIVLLQTGGALEIVINVPETDYAGSEPGLTIEERNKRSDFEVVLSAIPDRSFPAELKEFSTAADPTTRTFAATFSFAPPADVNVMPGMTARLILLTGEGTSTAATIPVQAAVEGSEGKPYVWVVDPASMKVAKATVTLGALTGSDVEVKAGLNSGDLVVTSGVHQLREGIEVRRMGN